MRIQLAKGQSLLDALRKANIGVRAACGGKGTCGLCSVDVYGYGRVKACTFDKPGIYEIKLPEKEAFRVLREEGKDIYPWYQEEAEKEEYVAVDLGTTTVAITSFSKGLGRREASFVNPQRSYGADVMSRIQAAGKGHEKELQKLIVEALEQQLQEKGVPEDIPVYLAGNTTMQHLMEGLSVQGLGSYPFKPVDISKRTCKGLGKSKRIYHMLPGISAYVGGDIVSGIYALDMEKEEKPVLLLDFGTNGEMVLWTGNSFLVTSTSAGPAFEGSELGMQLHASGILALLSDLRKKGILEESGLLVEPYFSQGYSLKNWKEGYDQVLTQDFVREIQMAKAAMAAGIEILLKKAKLTGQDVDKVYLAGGMGNLLNPDHAIELGLLPDGIKGKCMGVGNASLMGAIRMGKKPMADFSSILDKTREVLLAKEEDFQDLYMKHMNFPCL